jgi:uncharacterized protein YegL
MLRASFSEFSQGLTPGFRGFTCTNCICSDFALLILIISCSLTAPVCDFFSYQLLSRPISSDVQHILGPLEEPFRSKVAVLMKVCTDRCHLLDCQKLNRDQIEDISRLAHKYNFEDMHTAFEVKLPTALETGKHLGEFDENLTKICSLLSVEGKNVPQNGTDNKRVFSITQLLDSHAILLDEEFSAICDKYTNSDSGNIAKLYLTSLCQLVQDLGNAQRWRSRYEEQLGVLSFFTAIDSKLFKFLLSKEQPVGSNERWECEDFMAAIGIVQKAMQSLTDENTIEFKTIRDIVNHVGLKTAHKELPLVVCCKEIFPDEADFEKSLEGIELAMSLAELTPLVRTMVDVCRQYNFVCCAPSDEISAFTELQALIVELSDSTRMDGATVTECRELASKLANLLGFELHDQGSRDELLLFQELSQAEDVWSFVHEKKWHGTEGLLRFNDEYGNVTNLLQGETYETEVLDHLDPAVRYISLLIEAQKCPMPEFLTVIRNDRIVSGVGHRTKFTELKTAQRNISRIKEWFTLGLGGLEVVFLQFKEIAETGQYCFKITPGEGLDAAMTVRYKGVNGVSDLKPNELKDIVIRLGFVQHDAKAEGLPIKQFLSQVLTALKTARKLLFFVHDPLSLTCHAITHAAHPSPILMPLIVCCLVAQYYHNCCAFDCMVTCGKLGHPDYSGETLHSKVLFESETEASSFASKHSDALEGWQVTLLDIRTKYPLLLFFSTPEAIAMYGLIVESSVPELVLMISRLAKLDFKSNQTAVEASLQLLVRKASLSWPFCVGEFLAEWHKLLGAPPLPLRCRGERRIGAMETNERGVTTHHYDALDGHGQVIRLLSTIYKSRVPEVFEVLFCTAATQPNQLALFLRRALHFPDRTFTLIETSGLSITLQEQLLTFMMERKQDCDEVRLHCVQSHPSILQPAPWIRHHAWTHEGTRPLPSYAETRAAYKDLVVGGNGITNVAVVSSALPGMGKTHLIRKLVSNFISTGLTSYSFCITESFEICAMVQQLKTIDFSQHSPAGFVISFHIQVGFFGPQDASLWRKLVDLVNHFFVALLVLRCVEDLESGNTFNLPSDKKVRIIVEVPSVLSSLIHGSPVVDLGEVEQWVLQTFPILFFVGKLEIPNAEYDICESTKRVCKYLRAYDDGTINSKFVPVATQKNVIFVLDRSGSMDGQKIHTAVDNILKIFDENVNDGDHVSFVPFESRPSVVVPLTTLDAAQRPSIRETINRCRHVEGGTQLYAALSVVLDCIVQSRHHDGNENESWIVCLTDGCSSGHPGEVLPNLRRELDVNLIIIGVSLARDYVPTMRELCECHGAEGKGQYIASGSEVASLNDAFATAAQLLPVSEMVTFADISDDDCRALLHKHMPAKISNPKTGGMLLQRYWVQYLHRRILVFDESPDFNYNEKYDSLGGTLMETMLEEVGRALQDDHRKCWKAEAHQQLVYDFSAEEGPTFGLICTAPDKMLPATRRKYTALDFEIPTMLELHERSVLHKFLSKAMGIKLSADRIPIIESEGFILTLDFLLKLLNIHERVCCHIPCIMEGETGVSKTALTKMYSRLVNVSIQEKLAAETLEQLLDIASVGHRFPLEHLNNSPPSMLQVVDYLHKCIENTDRNIEAAVRERLMELCDKRGPLYELPEKKLLVSCQEEAKGPEESEFQATKNLLQWFSEAHCVATFFQINVHSSLSSIDVTRRFNPIIKLAARVGNDVGIVVFLDEINTSSCMGTFKGIVMDRMVDGRLLPENVTIVAACNPARSLATVQGGVIRQDDLGKDWALGHYQVHDLPKTMHMVKWNYGSLGPEQEKEFVARRLEILGFESDELGQAATAELICCCQEMIREFATEVCLSLPQFMFKTFRSAA